MFPVANNRSSVPPLERQDRGREERELMAAYPQALQEGQGRKGGRAVIGEKKRELGAVAITIDLGDAGVGVHISPRSPAQQSRAKTRAETRLHGHRPGTHRRYATKTCTEHDIPRIIRPHAHHLGLVDAHALPVDGKCRSKQGAKPRILTLPQSKGNRGTRPLRLRRHHGRLGAVHGSGITCVAGHKL